MVVRHAIKGPTTDIQQSITKTEINIPILSQDKGAIIFYSLAAILMPLFFTLFLLFILFIPFAFKLDILSKLNFLIYISCSHSITP